MSKQYCPECHIEMDYKAKEEYWICPECGHTTDLDDVKLGIDYPTLESTYEDKEESYDPETKYEDAYRRNECTDWIQSNKEIAIGIGTFAVGAGGSMIKGLAKRQKVKEEKQLKNNYCYDRSLGHYWKLRRELTNEEWIAIDKRKRNGERLGDILAELKVLK